MRLPFLEATTAALAIASTAATTIVPQHGIGCWSKRRTDDRKSGSGHREPNRSLSLGHFQSSLSILRKMALAFSRRHLVRIESSQQRQTHRPSTVLISATNAGLSMDLVGRRRIGKEHKPPSPPCAPPVLAQQEGEAVMAFCQRAKEWLER